MIMKKGISVFFLFLLTLPFVSGVVLAAPLRESGVFTFEDLGLEEEIVLNGPYDSTSLRFELPPTWQLNSGTEWELEISTYIIRDGGLNQSNSGNFVGATLEVYFNDKLQESIPLVDGEKMVYRFSLDDGALSPQEDIDWHRISFFLDAAIDCDLDFHDTTVTIGLNSKALFQYDIVPLSLDLGNLPRPLFQERRKLNDPVKVVIPDAPTADELQAGYVLVGSLARMSLGNLPVEIVRHEQLTDEMKLQSHLVFVGKPASFPELGNVPLSIPLAGEGFFMQDGTDNDGVIQIVPSPWNNSRALLIVSGNTDQAVVKSAQAVSTSNLQAGDNPSYSIVVDVNPISSLGVLSKDLTLFNSPDIRFYDLGFEAITVSDLGANWQSYEFVIPPGQIPSETPYISLNYSVSNLIDPFLSEGVVYLNDVVVGNVTLSSEGSNLLNAKVDLPTSILRNGLNLVDVVFNIVPKDDCSINSFSGLWVTIFSDSYFHIPLTEAPESSYVLQDIKSYPYPFSNDPSLASTTIVVPQNDYPSWQVAGKVVYDLAARVSGSLLAFEVQFENEISEDSRMDNLLFIGQPESMSVLTELRDSMPAYYEPGSNVAILESQQVIYRISENKDLGYLQLFTSPWNSKSAILGIFGTSSGGLDFAANALLGAASRDLLSGNFATFDTSTTIVVDTRTGLGLGRIDSSEGFSGDVVTTVVPSQVVPDVRSEVNAGRQLIVFAVGGILILMIVVVVVALRMKKKSL